MRLRLGLLAAAGALAASGAVFQGCSGPRHEITYHMDPARFRLYGVLPFTDSRGQGRALAEKVARGLVLGGVNAVDLQQLETVFRGLKLDYSSALSLHSLADVRQATLAEALVFGSLDSRWKEARVIIIETELGEIVLEARLRARRGRSFSGADEIAEQVLGLWGAHIRRDG